jgi:hypothetical protein
LLYLLDANVLIDANCDYYPVKRVLEFWEWLVFVVQSGHAKIPLEVYEEIRAGTDDLADWISSSQPIASLRLPSQSLAQNLGVP